jgi:chromate transporter
MARQSTRGGAPRAKRAPRCYRRAVASRLELARTFFVIGLTSYGGPAIVAQIRKVVVQRRRWLDDAEFQESLALCQLLPGPIAVQTAAHVGWRLHRGVGAVIAVAAYVLPAFALMLGLSAAYFRWGHAPIMGAVLKGMRAATVGIVVGSILSMGTAALRDWRGGVLALAAGAAFLLRLNVLAVLIGAGVAGLLLWRREGGAAPTAAPPAPRGYGRTLAWVGAVLVVFAGGVLLAGQLSPLYPRLAAVMVKVDLLAFGGGYTAVAIMYEQAVAVNAWLTPNEFIDGLALSQVTPGPVIVTATFIGYHRGGFLAAVFATVCVFVPSTSLLVLAAPQLERIRRLGAVARVQRGLVAAFMGMLFFVLWQVGRAAIVDPFTLLLTVGAIAALALRTNPAWIVAGAVAVALVFAR